MLLYSAVEIAQDHQLYRDDIINNGEPRESTLPHPLQRGRTVQTWGEERCRRKESR